MPNQLKYGPISPYATEKAKPAPITAGETFRAKSGRFVTLNAGYVEVADAGDALLFGWAEKGESGAVTVAGEFANVIIADGCTEVFRVPVITGTYVEAMLGKTCDLVRATVGGVTLIQGVDLTASGEDCLRIVGGDLVDNKFVDVMFAQAKVTVGTGVV
jgi:hypothetical protein